MSDDDNSGLPPNSIPPSGEPLSEVRFRAEESDLAGHNDEALRIRLSILEVEHHDLDAAILALESQGPSQSLVIARLKKRKLLLKDEMTRLRDSIEPDIIA